MYHVLTATFVCKILLLVGVINYALVSSVVVVPSFVVPTLNHIPSMECDG